MSSASTSRPASPATATLFDDARNLADQGSLWEAAWTLIEGFAQLGSAASAPETDSLGRPIRGSAPRFMEQAADYLDLLDNLERDGAVESQQIPPRHLRWAAWHTTQGQALAAQKLPGRAIDHLELAAGLFESEQLYSQAIGLLAQIAQCHLLLDDPRRAEEAINRAFALLDADTRDRYAPVLGELSAEVAQKLRLR